MAYDYTNEIFWIKAEKFATFLLQNPPFFFIAPTTLFHQESFMNKRIYLFVIVICFFSHISNWLLIKIIHFLRG